MREERNITGPLLILLMLMPTFSARANPVMIDGQSLIAFGIVAFWALVIESGLVTFALISRGVLTIPFFFTLIIANACVFLFAFLPLTSRLSLFVLEPGVVLADGIVIKILTSLSILQRGDYSGVTWGRALTASAIGNAASYFTGLIASQTPWIVHQPVQLD